MLQIAAQTYSRGSIRPHTTQRKPICVVALSCDWGDRAAGRWRWQYSGAHRCDPPLRVWVTAGSGSPVEGMQHAEPASGRWLAEYTVVVLSHTLLSLSSSPKAFAGNSPPGEVPRQPSAPSLR